MKDVEQNLNEYLKNNKVLEFRDRNYYLNEESLAKIDTIQKEKLALVEHMHELLQKVDSGESISISENSRDIRNDNGSFYSIDDSGEKQVYTKGDLMVAGMNGFDISLDANIDSQTKKEFILRETRRALKALHNEQIIITELENKNVSPRDLCIQSYKEIEKTKNLLPYESKQSGILAETMIESFLTKLAIDNPSLPFRIEMGNVYDDVRRKIDFKLHIKNEYKRGVKIETQKSDVAIQLTMDTGKTAFKEDQIRKSQEYSKKLTKREFDDFVLVTVSIDEIKKSLEEWNSQGDLKSLAGPSDIWTEQTRKLVFIKILEKLPPHLEIEPAELWESIQN